MLDAVSFRINRNCYVRDVFILLARDQGPERSTTNAKRCCCLFWPLQKLTSCGR